MTLMSTSSNVMCMTNARQMHLDFVREALQKSGLNQTQLALKAKISPSTLSRFFSGASDVLLGHSLMRISAVTGVALPQVAGFEEGEVEMAEIDPDQFAPPDPEKFPKLMTLKVKTEELVREDIQKGDHLVIDSALQPTRGALVCAQVYDKNYMKAETVIRWYEPPYLVSPSTDPAHRMPISLDEHVQIKGVVVRLLRRRELT